MEHIEFIKTAILFCVGILLIVDYAIGHGSLNRTVELIAGLVLVGMIPVDEILSRISHKKIE